MSIGLILFVLVLLLGLFCIGGFLWSAMQEKPKKVWLIGAAAAVIVAIAGLITHAHYTQ